MTLKTASGKCLNDVTKRIQKWFFECARRKALITAAIHQTCEPDELQFEAAGHLCSCGAAYHLFFLSVDKLSLPSIAVPPPCMHF